MIKTGRMKLRELEDFLTNKTEDAWSARFSDGYKVSQLLRLPDIFNCAYVYEKNVRNYAKQKQNFYCIYDLDEKGYKTNIYVFVIDKF